MQRPLFSSSYSAKLIEQRYRVEGGNGPSDYDWQQQQQEAQKRTRTRQWVRKGVTARGEVWGILSDADGDSDTVVDEHDDERFEGEDAETEKAEQPGSHGREYHDHAGSAISPRDAPAFSPSSPTTTTTRTTDMAAKTYWWISLW